MWNVWKITLVKMILPLGLSALVSACSLDASIDKNLSLIPEDGIQLPGGPIGGGGSGSGGGNGSPSPTSPSNSDVEFDRGETVQIPSGGGYEIQAVIGEGAATKVIHNSYTIEGSFQ